MYCCSVAAGFQDGGEVMLRLPAFAFTVFTRETNANPNASQTQGNWFFVCLFHFLAHTCLLVVALAFPSQSWTSLLRSEINFWRLHKNLSSPCLSCLFNWNTILCFLSFSQISFSPRLTKLKDSSLTLFESRMIFSLEQILGSFQCVS